jgi:hypothetical protein
MTTTYPSTDPVILSQMDRQKMVHDLYYVMTGDIPPMAARLLAFAGFLSLLLSILYLASEFLYYPQVNPKVWVILIGVAYAFGLAWAKVSEANRAKHLRWAFDSNDNSSFIQSMAKDGSGRDSILVRLEKADNQPLQGLHRDLKPMRIGWSYALNAAFTLAAFPVALAVLALTIKP